MKKPPDVKALPAPPGAVPPPPPPNPPPPAEPPRYPIPERCIFLVNDVPAMKFVIAWSIVPVEYLKHADVDDDGLWEFIHPSHFHRVAEMAGVVGREVAFMVRRFRAVGLIRSNGTCDPEALTYVRRELNAYEDSLKP